MNNVLLGASLSDPHSELHREWLGREIKDDLMNPDAYTFGFALDSITLERCGSDSRQDAFRILTLSTFEFHALISQWPSPWLALSPLMAGDPNAPLLVIRVTLDEVLVSEHLESLHYLLSQAKPAETKESDAPKDHTLFSVPRLSLDVCCGPICGRLIHTKPDLNSEPFILELRTDGFLISAHSQFLPASLSTPHHHLHPHELPLQLSFTFALIWKPTFIRVLSNATIKKELVEFSDIQQSEYKLMDDPALLSLETIEAKGGGRAFGHFGDENKSIACINPSTVFADIHCSADALFIELWQSNVINAVRKLISIAPSNPPRPTSPHPSRLLDRLPSGCSATVSLARFVIFVTAPDLNVHNDFDISRGLAFRTGISLQYCALRSPHVHHFKNHYLHTQTRHKLYLPEDRIVEAISAAKASELTQKRHAFFRISTWNLALRSALATQYATDDPHIAERDDPLLSAQNFLQFQNAKAEINISGKRDPDSPNVKDNLQVTVHIPMLRGSFALGHVYNLLLASKTMLSFSRNHSHRPSTAPETKFSHQFQGTVKTLQILWTLPGQQIYSRINSLALHSLPEGGSGVRWNKLLLCVTVPPHPNLEQITSERWEELGRLQYWDIRIPKGSNGSISVQGDSFRFRIPFGHILADLINDLGITVKCARHLVRAIITGASLDMPPPEAEAAKSIPNLKLLIRCVSVEAADDLFESKLNVIWRAGLDAAKQRNEREEAFLLKVAAIQQAESSLSSSFQSTMQLGSDYQFTSNHTVSVEEAHQRLLQVHDVDWNLRHRLLKQERVEQEESILRRIHTERTAKLSAESPDLVPIAPIDPEPPLLRGMLCDLSLNITPPSFPLEKLPEFMRDRGSGLPIGTQFSLLLPMHIHFTLSSLHATLRDYPLPLIDIPPNEHTSLPAWEFDTDLAIAEEMGSAQSVDWVECAIVEPHNCVHGAPLSISVPKTIMPVKTYANPVIRVTTNDVTTFTWGVCYGPATQDILRIAESLTSTPRDSSPAVGFWDKVSLLHMQRMA
jgi:RNA pol II promoter Fmp27 protein domain/Domain of unknown function (DUF2405)